MIPVLPCIDLRDGKDLFLRPTNFSPMPGVINDQMALSYGFVYGFPDGWRNLSGRCRQLGKSVYIYLINSNILIPVAYLSGKPVGIKLVRIAVTVIGNEAESVAPGTQRSGIAAVGNQFVHH